MFFPRIAQIVSFEFRVVSSSRCSVHVSTRNFLIRFSALDLLARETHEANMPLRLSERSVISSSLREPFDKNRLVSHR